MHICKIQKKEYISYLKEIKSKANHRLSLDLKLDKDFMWLAGLVASDGSIVEHKTKKYVKIKLGNNDLDLLKNCQKIFLWQSVYRIFFIRNDTYRLTE